MGQTVVSRSSGSSKGDGISVGSEWTYRSFVDGKHPGNRDLDFRRHHSLTLNSEEEGGLPIGLIVRVFRTHKGTIGKPITGSIQVRNPDPEKNLASDLIPFAALDAKIDECSHPPQAERDGQYRAGFI